ncbi:MAG: hypothetical protein HZA89_05340 [Verrucomicrobia bacterium]|nr:hypothetical protein [Verrucomicrobiota bacterium]
MKNKVLPIVSRRHFLTAAGGVSFGTFAGLANGLLPGAAFAAAPKARPSAPPPAGLRVFTCGHSFHVWAARMIADMAESAGIKGHKIAGVSSIGGSRVVQHWEVAEDKFHSKKLLTAGEVDVLTLSPIWLPDEGIENFAKLAFAHNPNIRITVQEYWLPNDAYNPVYPLETRKKVDHNATDLAELRKANARYEHDIEAHVREINQRLGKDALVVVPVGAASVALREKIVSMRVPGLKVQWRLFADDWGHATPPLKVLAAYCHFAVIYRRSPVGLPLPPELEQNREFAIPALNKLLQELAWDAVIRNPMTGVRANPEAK